jgi:NAD(P)-dependent dehydrogenase (short-subunit alcohol dehydrogenase family)
MVAYVTGAGSGIGRHLATTLAGRGASIAAFDRHIPDEARRAIAHARTRETQQVAWHEVDVTDADALLAAVGAAAADLGPPRLAVNSAGISRNAPFAVADRNDFEETVRVNLNGSRNFAAAVLALMQRGDRLALIASLAGLTGGYAYAAYAASKAGVIGLAKVLRLEYAPVGIGVSVICPPEIPTPMVERSAATEHPATRALKEFAGTLPIDVACGEMLEQLARGRFTVIPGRKARRAARLQRLLPERVSLALADRIVRRSAVSETPATPR